MQNVDGRLIIRLCKSDQPRIAGVRKEIYWLPLVQSQTCIEIYGTGKELTLKPN